VPTWQYAIHRLRAASNGLLAIAVAD